MKNKSMNIALPGLLLLGNLLIAQTQIKGVLLDAQTRQPVEFANVGIVGKGLGTVTDESGNYTLTIPDSLTGGIVKLSRIGYKSREMGVRDLEKNPGLLLEQSSTALAEVAVSAKKLKIKTVGNVTTTKTVSGGFKRNNLGAELAVKINIKAPKTQIRKFMIHINTNTLDNPVFRFNVYSVGQDGKPKDNLLTSNIVFEPKEKTGMLEVDLLPYSIYVDDDVFIAIEWVKDLGENKGLSFSTRLVGGATYYRQASQDKWEKIPSIGIGLHTEIGY